MTIASCSTASLRRLSAHFFLAALSITALGLGHSGGVRAALPELPRTFIDTTYLPPSGNTITVNAGGNLQVALNNALPGDTIVLQAGATFTGPFSLPNKGSSTAWIYVRSSDYANLPAPGNRVSPSNAGSMPKIVGPVGNAVAVQTTPGAHHFRFVGIEFKPAAGAFSYGIIQLGGGETSLSQIPHNLVFDRCYIHGDPAAGGRRGVALNSASTAIIDSYLSDWKEAGADSQAIAGWNTPGPVKIANNYLEGAGENIMFGGADPSVANLVPSDIEIRGNHVYKPVAWRTQGWTIKNLLELKNALRVLIEGNVFENSWAAAQEWAINLAAINQTNAPWSTMGDVTFRSNIVRHASNGITVCAQSCAGGGVPNVVTGRYLVENNLFEDINSATWGGSGRSFQMVGVMPGLVIDHNTTINSGTMFTCGDMAAAGMMTGFRYTNNLSNHGSYGFICSDRGVGLSSLNTYTPGYVFEKNVMAGGHSGNYPSNNFFPANLGAVGFVNASSGDYRLASTSLYKGAASDGKDVGANIDALGTATACATDGQCAGAFPPPPPPTGDTQPPIISAVSATGVTATQAVVSWVTNEPSDTQVEYGWLSSYGSTTPLNTAMTTSHSQTLTGLYHSTLYHFRVWSKDASGNVAVSGNVTFTTPPPGAPSDTTPPTISAVANAMVTSSAVTITWTTNEAADSQLEYGSTTAYGNSTVLDTAHVTSHSHAIGGLAAAQLYHYRVKSRDAAGNLATSGDFTFTTLGSGDTAAPSVPGGLTITNVTRTRATLGWNASTDNLGVAGYRLDVSTNSAFTSFVAGYQNLSVGNVTSFRIVNLRRSSTYYVRLRAYDAAGNTSSNSTTATLRTN